MFTRGVDFLLVLFLSGYVKRHSERDASTTLFYVCILNKVHLVQKTKLKSIVCLKE